MPLKLSREEQYGIMALIDLSRNTNSGSSRVKSIAARQAIPTRFLEQIFSKLRQADLVIGKRGPTGGYTLSRPAQEIKLNTVMDALRPSKIQVTRETKGLSSNLAQAVNSVWSEIEILFQNSLKEVSLAHLSNRAEKLFTEEAEVTAESVVAATTSDFI